MKKNKVEYVPEVKALVDKYFAEHDDFWDAVQEMVDDINVYARSKPHLTNENIILSKYNLFDIKEAMKEFIKEVEN